MQTPMETTVELLAAAAAGDQPAWDRIVERYGRLVWSVARGHRLNDADAEDVCQTTWLRLVEHLDTIADPERLAGWLATTARYESLRVLRRHGREIPVFEDPGDEQQDADPDPEQELINRDEQRRLLRAIDALNERCRSLLRIMSGAADEATYDQIAAALGIPIGSIGPTRARCIKRLRQLLA